ncbi:hypothetical protein BW716_34860 [[Flexibacter] sp. ATCC 35208]|nr:hypothetical protein BW716_34860 [[Flexibacter] sp. ATCC 35208]
MYINHLNYQISLTLLSSFFSQTYKFRPICNPTFHVYGMPEEPLKIPSPSSLMVEPASFSSSPE